MFTNNHLSLARPHLRSKHTPVRRCLPALARDGAGLVEVAVRAQRVFGELGSCGGNDKKFAAKRHAILRMGAPNAHWTFLQTGNYCSFGILKKCC